MRYFKAFGLFWWDFLIGDTPELAAGACVIILLAALISRSALVAALLVPALVVLLLGVSLQRGRKA